MSPPGGSLEWWADWAQIAEPIIPLLAFLAGYYVRHRRGNRDVDG